MKKVHLLSAGAILALAFTLTGCSDSYSTPMDPSGSGPGPEGAVVTLTASGADPKTVTVPVGYSVTFVNADSIAHEMASDPHPVHNDCPPLNRVGNLEPGQRMETGALTAARSCGYHDLLRDGDARWRGTIVVQ
jgi:plastocyanin